MFTFLRTMIFALCGAALLLSVNPALSSNTSGIRRLGYAIQMGAFADVKNAERFSATLQKKGIEAFYFRKDNGIYAVRFGDFPSKEKARVVAAKLVADRLIDGFYIAPPNEVVFADAKKPGWQKLPPDEIRLPQDRNPAGTKGTAGSVDKQPNRQTHREHDMGFIAARTAERFVGIPYRWGGDNVVEGMDCSGFVRAVYNLCGVSIPRTSREQFKAGDSVTRNTLLDGDLVFFGSSDDKINHVGIYVGKGKFVHAPRRGEDIRITSIEDTYFEKRFVGARRYFQ
ncbi:MAG: C40 family peptidase [Desulfuromonadales bacterium]|nr:C40 family peptidase [Desulfuromonadales bacterium]